MFSSKPDPVDRIKLKDEDRARIRWSSTKRGHVLVASFLPRHGRRGMKVIRPVRSGVFLTETEARKNAPSFKARWLDPISVLRLYTVDHLGHVQGVEEIDHHFPVV